MKTDAADAARGGWARSDIYDVLADLGPIRDRDAIPWGNPRMFALTMFVIVSWLAAILWIGKLYEIISKTP